MVVSAISITGGFGVNSLNYLSYTLVNNYRNCPHQWQFSWELQIPVPTPWSIFFGRCYDEALSASFKARIEKGVYLASDITQDIFNEHWNKGVTDEFHRDIINFTDEIDWSDNDPEDLREMGLALIEGYMNGIALNLTPVIIKPELKKQFLSAEGDYFDFIAHPDLLIDGAWVDWKTSSRTWGQKRADGDLQATSYLWASPYEVDFEFHIGLKTIPVDFQKLATRRSKKQLEEFEFVTLPETLTNIRQGRFPRIREEKDNWLCRFCGYYEVC